MNTQIMKLADINPAPYNPRKTLVAGDVQYEALSKSLERFGLVEPLVVNTRTGNLVGGHQRMNVLTAQGATEAEVVTIDVSEEDERLLNVALNKIDGEWDWGKLDDLLQELDPADIEFTGFDPSSISFSDDSVGESDDFPTLPNDGPLEVKNSSEDENKPFSVYLSFPSKEAALNWMADRGIERDYGGERNVNIKMNGVEYGSER